MMLSIMPVHEHQTTMMTSYQSGAPLERLARSCKSLSMYGALGKNISHRKAMTGIRKYSVTRFHELTCATYERINGIHARNRLGQIKLRCLRESLYTTLAPTNAMHTA